MNNIEAAVNAEWDEKDLAAMCIFCGAKNPFLSTCPGVCLSCGDKLQGLGIYVVGKKRYESMQLENQHLKDESIMNGCKEKCSIVQDLKTQLHNQDRQMHNLIRERERLARTISAAKTLAKQVIEAENDQGKTSETSKDQN